MSFEDAFNKVSELVNDFKNNEKSYLNTSYSEADVRNDFINKFFIALGWDVRHETQKNPYEQEVRVEKPVQIAKAQKRADYSFSLAPNFRTVKFFVEAKKPAHDLLNKDYYFQTARYGWNASTPIAVLTDFEEFHIIDCRFRPKIDDALNYELKQFHYSDYADKEKFAEIYWLFSREAAADGSIEKYAEALPKPRGKKVKGLKAAVQSIDDSFLEELDEIRTSLAKSFKKNNTHLSSEELTEATQRTIDRLVFIKFLEDKLIEPNHYVSEFGRRKKAWDDFVTSSRTLDAKYNGVVFKKSTIDSKSIIEPDDKTFSAICEELSHENTPYNFDAIPIHILGSIYERFLGKVVDATDKRVTIKEKPEVRKAGGVYYTPQYIVNYIVDNTVGKLIVGKTPKEIAKMRFADIACGSGSFLITVFERLLDYHKRWYIENPEQAKKDGCILVEGTYRLSLKQKTKILLNNVYGVDIDQQAVEVTQLSLYLKLLEDETTATANDTWVMFKEKLLPDLNKNIVCGNSLIGTDILTENLFLKGQVDFEEEKKLKPMDFETVFPEVMNSDGFDAIVGNPPYVRSSILDLKVRNYLRANYKFAKGQFDLYSTFIEKALKTLKNKGLFSYIIPRFMLFNLDTEIVREELLKLNLLSISEVGKAFRDANTECIIIVLDNSESTIAEINILNRSNHSIVLSHKLSLKDIFEVNNKVINTSLDRSTFALLKKISLNNPVLHEIADVKRGMEIGKNDIKKFTEGLKVLIGEDTKRYINDNTSYFVSKINKEVLRLSDEIESEKILIRRVSDKLEATIVNKNTAFTKNLYSIIPINQDNIKSILGIINSKLMNFYFKNYFTTKKQEIFPEIQAYQIKELPIKLNDEQIRLNSLVDQLLTAKKQLQQAKTESDKNYLTRKCETLDKQIDELVYQLYGLTEEEIKIVEEI